jgi:hypothetical protein
MLSIETYQLQDRDKFISLSDHTHDMELKTNDNRGDSLTKVEKWTTRSYAGWRLDTEGVLQVKGQ